MAQFDDLITEREPAPNRKTKTKGPLEHHFTEAAVMLAFAMHIFEAEPSVEYVKICPDGEHGKRFDIRGWLEARGYVHESSLGRTSYGGVYKNGRCTITVALTPGLGDVVAKLDQREIVAECKGGIVNTRHPGQLSRLRKGLCEAVGLLLTRSPELERHIAVAPYTNETVRLSKRMAKRANAAGIEIALIRPDGQVTYIL